MLIETLARVVLFREPCGRPGWSRRPLDLSVSYARIPRADDMDKRDKGMDASTYRRVCQFNGPSLRPGFRFWRVTSKKRGRRVNELDSPTRRTKSKEKHVEM